MCKCGGMSEYIHKVVRNKELQGEFQECPACGRILWLWKSELLDLEIKETQKGELLTK